MDSGSTSNYIHAPECPNHGIKVEVEDQSEKLKMAYGIMVRIEGQASLYLSVVGTEVKFLPGYFPI